MINSFDFYEEFEAYVKGDDNEIIKLVNIDEKGDAVERMNIYRDSYSLRLIDVLFGDFPTLHQILGDEDFLVMAKNYLATYPSTSFTVRYFGRHLPRFLREIEPYSNHGYLAQIADFEWEKGTVFDAPDTVVLTLEKLGSVPAVSWPEVRFNFIPAIRRLIYDYNIPQIWQAVNEGSIDAEPTILEYPISWVLWRKGLNPSWFSLDVDEDWALTQAQNGASFAEICEGLAEWIDEENIAARAALIVRTWIDEGLLESLSY